MEEDRRAADHAQGRPSRLTISPDSELRALATACGVVTSHHQADGTFVKVSVDTLRAVLDAMEVPIRSAHHVADSLATAHERAKRRSVPPSAVVRAGESASVGCADPTAELVQEDGATAPVEVSDGQARLPALPLGYHELRAGGQTCLLIAAPERCPPPSARAWGWMTQLYALRSSASWGVGDLADLALLARESAVRHGAGFVVCNPLHAAAPVQPQEDSPYYPSSRRFTNPLYLRVEDIPEYEGLDPVQRDTVGTLAARAREACAERIDRDSAFASKNEALSLVSRQPLPAGRAAAFARYRAEEGEGLERFAQFCALAELHGPDYRRWPAPLRHPGSPAVGEAAAAIQHRVDFHAWAQWCCDEQLAGAQADALAAGMIGIFHDLAVGVAPGGAEAWASQDDLAHGMRVGAPPDAFNQRGQDWGLPPLRPDRLVATGYQALRELLATLLRHAGGLRIDHILGLFRLFWIPEGGSPADGAYVRYPAQALLAVTALEAARAGAVIVGEDLGTVEEGVREQLSAAGVLGSRVLYFERDPSSGQRLPAASYPGNALASVTTHDLPTAAGWWQDAEVWAQADAGALGEDRTVEGELRRKGVEREEMAALLRDEGLLPEGEPSVEELVVAMHAFLARTPCCLVGVAPSDAVGDTRQPNLPGTTGAYPNWRLPLADSDGRPISVEAFLGHPGVARLARVLGQAEAGGPSPPRPVGRPPSRT